MPGHIPKNRGCGSIDHKIRVNSLLLPNIFTINSGGNKMKKAIIVLYAWACLCGATYGADREWIATGLGGGGGLYAPALSPHDSLLALVSCDMSGVYRSVDGGSTWQMINYKQIQSGFNCCPVFHPTDANKIYTYAKKGNQNTLLVSNDKGITWNVLTTTPPSGTIVFLYIDRGNALFMLAGTTSEAYRSSNGGSTWTKCSAVSGNVLGFLVDQSSPVENRVCFVATDTGGVYRSDDGGTTWIQKISGLPSASLKSFAGGSTGSTVTLYCLAASNNDVYVSKNKGDAWTKAMGGGIDSAITYSHIVASDATPNVLYANGMVSEYVGKIYKSTNTGESWVQVWSPSISGGGNVALGWLDYDMHLNPPSYWLNISASNPNHVIGTRTVPYITYNGGTTWKQAYTKYADTGAEGPNKKWASIGIGVTSSWNYAIDPFDKNKHYICYTDIGFTRSEDAGKTWTQSRSGSPWPNSVYQIAFDPRIPGTIYGAASNKHDLPFSPYEDANYPGGVIKSTNYGKTWNSASTGLPVDSNFPATSIIMDPRDTALYVTAYGNGVYKSTDRGGTWIKKSTGLAIGANKHCYALKLHSDGSLFCAIVARRPANAASSVPPEPGGLFKSVDKGETWANISSNLPLKYQMDFDVHPQNSKIIYMCAYAHNEGGIYKTTNGGSTWTKLSAPMSDLSGFSATIDSLIPATVYVTGHSGLFMSNDSGNTWSELTGLPFGLSTRVYLDYVDNNMYVTTFGGGVWKTKRTAIPTAVTTVLDAKEFPNQCKIRKTANTHYKIINLRPYSTVEIYNSTGKLIRKLQAVDSGNVGYVNWDGKNSARADVPSGMYFLSIFSPQGKNKTSKVGIAR
jgi:photosystem II stability/assembly factor-like uncharacterized protein